MIFRRKVKDDALEAAYQQAMESFDRRWAAGRASRPERFPEGEAFDPDGLIGAVRDAYWRVIHETDPDDDPDLGGITLLLATVSEIQSSTPSMTFPSAVSAVRRSMMARGAVSDAEAVGELAQYVMRWWQESGSMDEWIAATDGMTEEELRRLP